MKPNLTMQDLLDAGCHFGHTRGRWHPAMKPFVYLTRERIHIMDLEKTVQKLDDLTTVVENFVAAGNDLVLVGTKRQAKKVIEDVAAATKLPYVSNRWLGGTLTNFETVKSSIKRLRRLEEILATEDSKISKKERTMKAAELERMEAKFGGLKELTVVPQGLFVIDPSYEENAIKEARRLGLSIFALLDTSSNPALVDEFVPANDDAAKSIELIMGEVQAAIERGQKRAKENVKVAEEAVETKTKQ
jgi:small subunit ribosomal protein S2